MHISNGKFTFYIKPSINWTNWGKGQMVYLNLQFLRMSIFLFPKSNWVWFKMEGQHLVAWERERERKGVQWKKNLPVTSSGATKCWILFTKDFSSVTPKTPGLQVLGNHNYFPKIRLAKKISKNSKEINKKFSENHPKYAKLPNANQHQRPNSLW